MKWFLGLAADEAGPDHLTLTKFKARIEKSGQESVLEKLLAEVIGMAVSRGVRFGAVHLVDSTHTLADVNVAEDKHRQEQGKPRRDGDARWGVKGKKGGKRRGKKRSKPHCFRGHKMHTAMNARSEMITSLLITGVNAHEGKQFPKLVEKDPEHRFSVDPYAADEDMRMGRTTTCWRR